MAKSHLRSFAMPFFISSLLYKIDGCNDDCQLMKVIQNMPDYERSRHDIIMPAEYERNLCQKE